MAFSDSADHMHDAVLVGERSAEDDEPRVHEPVHGGGVCVPVGLLLQRTGGPSACRWAAHCGTISGSGRE